MGLVDAFGPEDRVDLKVSQLIEIIRTDALSYAQNQCLVNGIKAHLPYNHMLIMIDEEPTCLDDELLFMEKED